MVEAFTSIQQNIREQTHLAVAIYQQWGNMFSSDIPRVKDISIYIPVKMNHRHSLINYGCFEDHLTSNIIFYFNNLMLNKPHISAMIAPVMIEHKLFVKEDNSPLFRGIPSDRIIYAVDLYYADWPMLAKTLMFNRLLNG